MTGNSPQTKKTILIVDDETSFLDLLTSYLEEDYRVIAVKDGASAVKRAAAEPVPDLVLLDIVMPEMDGYQVCQKLQQDPQTCDIPVIFSTSVEDEHQEARGFSLGAVDYVTKPFSSAVIKARIETHLKLHDAQNTLRRHNLKLASEVERQTEQTATAYEHLRHQETKFHTLVSNIPGAVYRCALDENWTMEFISDEIEAISGYPAENFINNRVRSFASIIHPDDAEVVDSVVKEAVAERRPYNMEYRILDSDGQPLWVYEQGRAVFDDGTPLWLDGVIFDISQQKTADKALSDAREQLHDNLLQTIQALGNLLDKRDPYTAGHQQRVSELAVAIAREMGLDEEIQEGIRMGGSIHDIGKIHIPAELLNRPGKLSEHEFQMVKSHPEVGYEIINAVDLPWPVADMIHQHHERLDGSGYPRGLKGDEIILEARILAVADVVEAIASHRPYRPAREIEVALEEIRCNSGTLYDPEVVDTCLRLFSTKAFTWETG
ncbi:MAG: HD domain-containing phosphohydrolase [Sedimenticola sp.]